MKPFLKIVLLCALLLNTGWGFFVHQRINRLAVFTLPPEMIRFYKKHLQYISGAAVNPDRRRYLVPEEGARHYIDLDRYDNKELPLYWMDAVARYSEDSLQQHGVLPWYLPVMVKRLEEAFAAQNTEDILRYSAELGHYVGDAHVPLHTTSNYDGQLTGQRGIHALWESRLPELFHEDYNFFVGPAAYVENVQGAAWDMVRQSHTMVDTVLQFEKELSEHGETRYSYETKGKKTEKVFSFPYSRKFHDRLAGMVERRWRSSVRMTASLWYTAWVNAGQPDLSRLLDVQPDPAEQKRLLDEYRKIRELRRFKPRPHETDSLSGSEK